MRSPLELPAFIDWLEKQPADDKYNFEDNHHCLIGQYFSALGLCPAYIGGVTWGSKDGSRHELPDEFKAVARPAPFTFGAALTRARALLAQSPTRVVQS